MFLVLLKSLFSNGFSAVISSYHPVIVNHDFHISDVVQIAADKRGLDLGSLSVMFSESRNSRKLTFCPFCFYVYDKLATLPYQEAYPVFFTNTFSPNTPFFRIAEVHRFSSFFFEPK